MYTILVYLNSLENNDYSIQTMNIDVTIVGEPS